MARRGARSVERDQRAWRFVAVSVVLAWALVVGLDVLPEVGGRSVADRPEQTSPEEAGSAEMGSDEDTRSPVPSVLADAPAVARRDGRPAPSDLAAVASGPRPRADGGTPVGEAAAPTPAPEGGPTAGAAAPPTRPVAPAAVVPTTTPTPAPDAVGDVAAPLPAEEALEADDDDADDVDGNSGRGRGPQDDDDRSGPGNGRGPDEKAND